MLVRVSLVMQLHKLGFGRDLQNLSVFGPLPGTAVDRLIPSIRGCHQSQARLGDLLDKKNTGSLVAGPMVAVLIVFPISTIHA